MKKSMWILIVLLFVCGCGQGADKVVDEVASRVQDSPPKPIAANNTEDVKNTVASVQNFIGQGKTDTGAVVKIQLNAIGRKVDGKLEMDSDTLQVVGVLDNDTIRCWLASLPGKETVWRGNLMGEFQGNRFAGTFRFANSAAREIVSGTWQSAQ